MNNKILVLNCGSQSIKWKLFGLPAQAGEDLSIVKSNKIEVLNSADYQNILEEELKKISSEQLNLIGHRLVHGGGIFTEPLKITQDLPAQAGNLSQLEKINHLAPLHNPYNVLGIKACQNIFAGVDNIAVFDTEFFANLPEVASTYALPEDVVKEFNFKRFGFHGTSHEYVAKEAAKKIKKPFEKLKIITCHLGGGASVSAIKNSQAIDISMGFTPMEGVVMTTRAGNIDSGIVLELVREFGLDRTGEILNKRSGLKGLCGESEMLKVLERVKAGDKQAKLAFDVFVYSIKKYIGAYFAVLGGCDVLVFTGSIGAGDPLTRETICKDLEILNPSTWLRAGTKILAIETDEELAIANKIKLNIL